LPLEAVVGWDAELNGNLAELLQEPALMGALEGAGITVLAKGVNFPSDPFDRTLLAGFPAGTTLLTANNCPTNPFPSNFYCNPSSIDGLGITDSSQGGGAIFVHGWAHKLQIANNRIYNNAGTLSGGINLGQGEFPPATIKGGATNAAPYEGTGNFCAQGIVATGAQLPYCFNVNVNIHNNYITANSSTGDELFSATPAGAGGVSICTGNDYYLFDYNWVCGNLSSGDGGGFGHLGVSYNGDIEHNSFLFNQSTNPTIPASGGGMIIMGSPDADIVCNAAGIDQDCTPPNTPAGIVAAGIGPSDGTGPNLLINANLIMGNGAESGSGGGIAFQAVNGADMVAFPNNYAQWNKVTFTNNIVSNNVAGWDGAGISLVDSVNVDIINNTIMHNDTTASSGVLFSTLNAPLAAVPPNTIPSPACTSNCGTSSLPQAAGLVVIQNSAILTANLPALPATVTCPPGHYTTGTSGINSNCRNASIPLLANDVFWQNRDFHISVGALGTGTLTQQNVVALLPTLSQATTGQCVTGATYWDIGVRGDTGPGNHGSGVTLAPTYSILTSTTGYPGTGNTAANPAVVHEYCNGSRVPPELGTMGYQVPPGISDATVPNPIFDLTPAATVDEGNNWINISWGPLAMTNPAGTTTLGNYSLTAGSTAAIDHANSTNAPPADFFGTHRPQGAGFDIGAVEFQAAPVAAPTLASIAPASGARGTAVNVTLTGTNLTGATAVTVSGTGVTVSGITATSTTVTATFTIAASVGGVATTLGARTVSVTTPGGPGNTVTFTVAAGVPTLTPATRNFGNATRGVGALAAPTQIFTLTNNGSVNLTGVGPGVLGALNPTEFSIVQLLSSCGPAIPIIKPLGQTTLVPGALCTVVVQFRPLTTQTTGAKTATVSVTDSAGTQTSTLTGTAQ
jgi:hypothetical protein